MEKTQSLEVSWLLKRARSWLMIRIRMQKEHSRSRLRNQLELYGGEVSNEKNERTEKSWAAYYQARQSTKDGNRGCKEVEDTQGEGPEEGFTRSKNTSFLQRPCRSEAVGSKCCNQEGSLILRVTRNRAGNP